MDGRMTSADAEALRIELGELARTLPTRIQADPDNIDTGLARLVVSLIEFLRQVLEHQAVRRLDSGSLSPEEEERLGLAFLKLDERMTEIRETLGLSEEDVNIDLGPLGRLL